MQLSVTIGTVAVILGVALAMGHALGEGTSEAVAAGEAQKTPEMKGPAQGGAPMPDSTGGA